MMTEHEENKRGMLSPKIDVVFQILFGEVGSERITKDLLNSMLDEEVQDVELNENIVLRREIPEGKMGIVDVLAKVNNNEYCNVEMQVAPQAHIIKRMLYYWSRQYAREIKKSERYGNLKRTIVILIANFEIKGLENLDFHSKWQIKEAERGKIVLTEDFELHIIEMSKMYKNRVKEKDKKLQEWLCFLENPESKEVQDYMSKNENIKEANEELKEMSEDERLIKLAELREKAILDEREAEDTGYIRGKEEGKAEGERNSRLEIARNMKKDGMDANAISRLTGLSKDEIEQIS